MYTQGGRVSPGLKEHASVGKEPWGSAEVARSAGSGSSNRVMPIAANVRLSISRVSDGPLGGLVGDSGGEPTRESGGEAIELALPLLKTRSLLSSCECSQFRSLREALLDLCCGSRSNVA